jgi:hypothetical protein
MIVSNEITNITAKLNIISGLLCEVFCVWLVLSYPD